MNQDEDRDKATLYISFGAPVPETLAEWEEWLAQGKHWPTSEGEMRAFVEKVGEAINDYAFAFRASAELKKRGYVDASGLVRDVVPTVDGRAREALALLEALRQRMTVWNLVFAGRHAERVGSDDATPPFHTAEGRSDEE